MDLSKSTKRGTECSWEVLTEDDVHNLRETTWDFLQTTGFTVQHPGLLACARKAGAQVDETNGRVRVSRPLACELMAAIPARYEVRNILGQTWEIGGERQWGLAIVTDPWIIDYDTRQPRRPVLEDLRRHTLIAEQLDAIAAVSCMDFPVADVAGPNSNLRALEMHLLHHTRHSVVMATSLASLREWRRILQILARGEELRGLASAAVATGSPLVLNAMNGDILFEAIDAGFALQPTVCPMAGSTAPYSLAGTLLQSHLEVLMVTLLAQMVQRGTPVLYACGLSTTDLRTAEDLYYTLDKVLWKIASVQLARAERMPAMAESGGTMTFRYDPQSGAEGMLFMLAAHASGAHLLSGFGSCHNAVGMSAEMMVIQAAYFRASQHLTRGIRIDDARLAVESLRRVGPGGHFLEDDLTLQLMRSDEFFSDPMFDLSGGKSGGGSLLERAHAQVEKLVTGAKSRVPEDVQENLRRYFADRCAALDS
jgi:trimethylamine---corrinoid protein Co-methyltransferase